MTETPPNIQPFRLDHFPPTRSARLFGIEPISVISLAPCIARPQETNNERGNSLRRILHLERIRQAIARRRRAAANGLDAEDLLQAAGGAGLGDELEPGDSALALQALGGVRGRVGARVLAAGELADLQRRGDVQLEEGRGRVGEEVHAAETDVGRRQLLARRALPDLEVQRRPRQRVGQVRAGRYQAGGVEERCERPRCLGRLVGLGRVARVVLCPAADGDVPEVEVWGW